MMTLIKMKMENCAHRMQNMGNMIRKPGRRNEVLKEMTKQAIISITY